jgi:hypothetical protein
MLINDAAAKDRLESPLNLINRLAAAKNSKNSAMSLFMPSQKQKEIIEDKRPRKLFGVPDPSEIIPESLPTPTTPLLTDILENSESQIKLGLAHDKALDLLHRSVDMLALKLDEVKSDRLPSVIAAASKTVESIRRERNEASKNNKDREVHYHFYTPEQRKIEQYEVIDVQ